MYHCDHEKLPLLKLLSSSQTIRNDRIKINNRTTYFVNSRLNSNSVLGRYHRVYFLTNVFLMLILSIFHIELVLANNKVEDASISNKNYKERKMLQQDHRRNTNRYKLNNNEMHELMITPQNHDDISSSTTNSSNNINDDYMINSNTTNNLINSNMNDDNEQIIMNYYNEWMISPKIVGGNPIPQGTYPYYAFSAGNKLCGGTLIWDDIILSAAHCQLAWIDGASIGGIYLNGTDQDFFSEITQEIIHPNYIRGPEYNDIMLVQLTTPIISSSIATLNTNANIPIEREMVTVIGFGDTIDGGNPSDILLGVTVDVFNFTYCNRIYGTINDTIQICAGTDIGGRDSCQGDSGGPLLTTNDIQVGIVSTGTGCARPGRPAIYTRVSAYEQWIRQTICDISVVSPPTTFCNTDNIPSRRPSTIPSPNIPSTQPSTTPLPNIPSTQSPSLSPSIPSSLSPSSVPIFVRPPPTREPSNQISPTTPQLQPTNRPTFRPVVGPSPPPIQSPIIPPPTMVPQILPTGTGKGKGIDIGKGKGIDIGNGRGINIGKGKGNYMEIGKGKGKGKGKGGSSWKGSTKGLTGSKKTTKGKDGKRKRGMIRRRMMIVIRHNIFQHTLPETTYGTSSTNALSKLSISSSSGGSGGSTSTNNHYLIIQAYKKSEVNNTIDQDGFISTNGTQNIDNTITHISLDVNEQIDEMNEDNDHYETDSESLSSSSSGDGILAKLYIDVHNDETVISSNASQSDLSSSKNEAIDDVNHQLDVLNELNDPYEWDGENISSSTSADGILAKLYIDVHNDETTTSSNISQSISDSSKNETIDDIDNNAW